MRILAVASISVEIFTTVFAHFLFLVRDANKAASSDFVMVLDCIESDAFPLAHIDQ